MKANSYASPPLAADSSFTLDVHLKGNMKNETDVVTMVGKVGKEGRSQLKTTARAFRLGRIDRTQ